MVRIEGVRDGKGSLLARIAFFFCRRKIGRVVQPLRIHAVHGRVLAGYAQMELAQDKARRVPAGIKALGQLRIAMRIGCPF